MINETDRHNYLGQQIVYGTIKGIDFRLEVNELNVYGAISALLIGGYKAKIDDTKQLTTSDIPDKYKMQVADLNKKYRTYFLVESQLTRMEGAK